MANDQVVNGGMIQIPALVLAGVLASIYAAAFWLWKGRGLRDLLFFWLAAVVGFAAGQIAGFLLDLIPWTIGQVRVVEGTALAWLFLALARWLTLRPQGKGGNGQMSK